MWDVIVLSETWVEKKAWESIKDRLPEEYKWKMQEAKREYKKGRTKGDMILGIKKDLIEEVIEEETEENGLIVGRMRKCQMENHRSICKRGYRTEIRY